MHSEQQIFDYLQQKFGIRFTEQQQAAVQTIDGPVLLLAVPGAGKTTVMVARIANMIFLPRHRPVRHFDHHLFQSGRAGYAPAV